MTIHCIGCGDIIRAGHEIRRLTYGPHARDTQPQEHRPWDREPLVGYACSEGCGLRWMARQDDRDKRLRMVVSQTTALSEVSA